MKPKLSIFIIAVMVFSTLLSTITVYPGRALAADAPTIDSFAPAAAGEGAAVAITGENFTGATSVAFGGVEAFEYTVDSDTQITARVAYGSSGSVRVTAPSGSAQKEGFTYAASGVYTFDYLPLGNLHGVDNWVSSEPTDGTLHHVAVPGVAGRDGTRAAQFPTTNSDDTATRVNDEQFRIPDFAASGIHVIEFETLTTYWGSQFGLIHDANGNGKQDSGENGWELWSRGKDREISFSSQGGASVSVGSFPAVNDYVRYQIVIDRTGYGGAGSASVWYKNLTANTAWQEVPGMQDVNMRFDTGAGSSNPANWNGMYLYSSGNGPASVFDNIAFRRVEASSRSVTFDNTIVGATRTQRMQLSGDHLTGNLNATLTGDYEFSNGTQSLAGLNDGSEIDVVFRPTAEGARAGTLVLQGEDMNAPLTIALSGIGDNTGTIFTVAGVGLAGSTGDGGVATSARLNEPRAMAMDDAGNLYFADSANNRIRKVDAGGIITTVIVGGLDKPYGLALDSVNEWLYVADTMNHNVKKYDLNTYALIGTVPTPGITLKSPNDVAVDGAGMLYISDTGNHRIVKSDPAAGTAEVLAGTGTNGHSGDGGSAKLARISYPEDIAIDQAGNLYFSEYAHSVVRKVDANGIITTVAGAYNSPGYTGDGGLAVHAKLNEPESVAVDGEGNLYIGDKDNFRIRRVSAETGIITTVAGTGTAGYSGDHGAATGAMLNSPQNMWVDSAGNIYFSDFYNQVIRKVRAPYIEWEYGYPRLGTATDHSIELALKTSEEGISYYVALPHGDTAPSAAQIKAGKNAAGDALTDGLAGQARLAANTESVVSIDPLPPAVYDLYIVTEYVSGAQQLPVARITAGVAGTVVTVAGNGTQGFDGDDGPASDAEFRFPLGLAVDRAGNLHIGDNNRVRSVDRGTGLIQTTAGNANKAAYSGDGGLATDAGLEQVRGLAFDNAGHLYISDWNSGTVRKVDGNGVITTIAGSGANASASYGGPATGVKLNHPHGIAIDSAGNLYIADTDNNVIRKVDPGGMISTVAGNGTAGFSGDGGAATEAALNGPQAVAIDSKGDLYIGDTANFRVRRVDRTTGVITTMAGDGSFSYKLSADGTLAKDSTGVIPRFLAFDSADNLYIGQEQFIRRIDAETGLIHRIFGNRTLGFIGGQFTGDNGPAILASANWIYAMTADPSGRIYFSDGNSRIREIYAPYLVMTVSAAAAPDSSAQLNVRLSQEGIAYYVAVSAGSQPPSFDQVKAGTNADDQAVAAGQAGQANVAANTTGTIDLADLPGNTEYDVYVVAENTARTEQFQPTKVAIVAGLGDAEAVEAAKAALAVGFAPGDGAASVTQDLNLPTAGPGGTTISWTSSATDAVSVTGDVYRLNGAHVTVTLTATIRKGDASVTKTFDLVVVGYPATLASIGQDHWPYTLQVGQTHQTVVTAVYSDQSLLDVTSGASYLSSNPAVASVSAGGLVTANAAGTATITAAYGGKSMTQEVTVQAAEPDFTLTLDVQPVHVIGDGVSQVSITGTVLTREAQPAGVPNVPISFRFGSGTTVTQTVYTDISGLARITYTAPDIAGVVPRTEIVSVEATDTITGAKTFKNVEVHYLPATINGIVKDHAGQPLRDAAISVSADFNQDGIADFTAEGLTAADGSYSIAVPRGNWHYRVVIRKQIQLEDGRTVMVDLTQSAPVGTLNGTGEQIASANQISGLLVAVNPDNTTATTSALFGAGNVKARIIGTGGTLYNNTVTLDANGEFDVNDVPTGNYQIQYRITSPDGDALIGPTQSVTVDANGQVSVADSLVDPYGTVTDAVTGLPIPGVTLTLRWAYTAGGHQKDDPVPLPELPGFAPNRNLNSQITTAEGKYAWMVFPDEDYYIVASKTGYRSYSTLATPPADVPAGGGSTSFIQDGIIHVGNTIVKLDFTMSKLPSDSEEAEPQPAPIEPEPEPESEGVEQAKYVNGYPDGTFRPNRQVSRAEMATMLYFALALDEEPTSHAFPDVPEAFWGSRAIAAVSSRGIMIGYPDGAFQPDRMITRAEMAVIASKIRQLEPAAGDARFADTMKSWANRYIAAAAAEGLMQGYPDGTFKPDRPLTRAEAVAVINRLTHRQPLTEVMQPSWTDVGPDFWAYGDIEAASSGR